MQPRRVLRSSASTLCRSRIPRPHPLCWLWIIAAPRYASVGARRLLMLFALAASPLLCAVGAVRSCRPSRWCLFALAGLAAHAGLLSLSCVCSCSYLNRGKNTGGVQYFFQKLRF